MLTAVFHLASIIVLILDRIDKSGRKQAALHKGIAHGATREELGQVDVGVRACQGAERQPRVAKDPRVGVTSRRVDVQPSQQRNLVLGRSPPARQLQFERRQLRVRQADAGSARIGLQVRHLGRQLVPCGRDDAQQQRVVQCE
eukprot:6194361-Pleurochrysis_carterae.AAC.3